MRKYKRKMRRTPQRGVSYIKRKIYGTLDLSSAAGRAFYVTANDVNFTSDLSNLYDAYKISRIKVQFEKMITPIQGVPSGAAGGTYSFPVLPRLVAAIDCNDDNAPTSFGELREYGNSRIWSVDQSRTFYFKPKINLSAERNQGTVSPAYSANPTWLKFVNSGDTVRHRGLKVYNEQYYPPGIGSTWASSDPPLMNYTITVYMKVKDIK